MKANYSVLIKSVSPSILMRVVKTFDRITLLIISICWSVTIAVMIFALYTINLSISAKKDVETVLATEPTLPRINHIGVGGKELQLMLDRLQKRYPDVTVTWNNNVLSLSGANGGVYHQWLTAIGQVDTLYPDYHWRIQGFCVGKVCGEKNMMNIDLIGEKIAFELPQPEDKK